MLENFSQDTQDVVPEQTHLEGIKSLMSILSLKCRQKEILPKEAIIISILRYTESEVEEHIETILSIFAYLEVQWAEVPDIFEIGLSYIDILPLDTCFYMLSIAEEYDKASIYDAMSTNLHCIDTKTLAKMIEDITKEDLPENSLHMYLNEIIGRPGEMPLQSLCRTAKNLLGTNPDDPLTVQFVEVLEDLVLEKGFSISIDFLIHSWKNGLLLRGVLKELQYDKDKQTPQLQQKLADFIVSNNLPRLQKQPDIPAKVLFERIVDAFKTSASREKCIELLDAYMKHPGHTHPNNLQQWRQLCHDLPAERRGLAMYLINTVWEKHNIPQEASTKLIRSMDLHDLLCLHLPLSSLRPGTLRSKAEFKYINLLIGHILTAYTHQNSKTLSSVILRLSMMHYFSPHLTNLVSTYMSLNERRSADDLTVLRALKGFGKFQNERRTLFTEVSQSKSISWTAKNIAKVIWGTADILSAQELEKLTYSFKWRDSYVDKNGRTQYQDMRLGNIKNITPIVKALKKSGVDLPMPLLLQYSKKITHITSIESSLEEEVIKDLKKKMHETGIFFPVFRNICLNGYEADLVIPHKDRLTYTNVECDGPHHQFNYSADAERDSDLRLDNIHTIRIPCKDFNSNRVKTIELVFNELIKNAFILQK